MASNWVRVDADIGRDAGMARARRLLGVTRPTMTGMVVLLEIELLGQHQSGEIDAVDPATLAEWAGWEGDLSLFRQALEELTDNQGILAGWDERHGVLIDRLGRDAERKRLKRAEQKAAKAAGAAGSGGPKKPRRKEIAPPDGDVQLPGTGDIKIDQSSNHPEDVLKTSFRRLHATERNGTERDGTERSQLRDSESASASGNGSLPAHRSVDAKTARAGEPDAAPATARLVASLEQLAATAPAAIEFLSTFYAREGTNPKRRRDVASQLVATLTPEGAQLRRGVFVRAHSAARLNRACYALLHQATPIRDPDKAIVALLTALNDTAALTEDAAAAERQANLDEHRRQCREKASASAWLKDHPAACDAIEAALDAEGVGDTRGAPAPSDPLVVGMARMTREWTRDQYRLRAWREAGSPTLTGAAP